MELGALAGRRGIAVLAALATAGLAAGYGISVRARPKPLAIPLSSESPAGKSPAAKSARRMLYVHVAGAVAKPGLYRLADGSRVDDAVRVAGGPRPDADLDSLNLATRLRDGDKVQVPARGAAGAVGSASGGGAGGGGPGGGKVNLNSASLAELDALPGIGPSLAQRIIAYREEYGGFRSVKDLQKVPGIGARKFADLEERVTV